VDGVEEVGFSVGAMIGRASSPLSGRHRLHRRRDQLGELAEVLGGGGEDKLVSGAAGAA
jgi:hypothetical protein